MWSERVALWKTSGKTCAEFTAGQPYTAGTLKWWSYRLAKLAIARAAPANQKAVVAMAKVIRGSSPETSLTIEVQSARIVVRSGFDACLLRDVVAALGAAE